MLANPTIDYQVHNTLFLVAHFHNVLIPGLLFGMLAGYHFWFPKAFGFRLNERWGMIAASCWIVGFTPGLFSALCARSSRLSAPDRFLLRPGLSPLHDCSFASAHASSLPRSAAWSSSFWCRSASANQNRVPAGDPWDGRSLEWAVSAPPPEYNFSLLPRVTSRDAFTGAKESGHAYRRPETVFRHQDAEKQRHGHDPLRERRADRLRSDLAHLVAGRSWRVSRPSRRSSGGALPATPRRSSRQARSKNIIFAG